MGAEQSVSVPQRRPAAAGKRRKGEYRSGSKRERDGDEAILSPDALHESLDLLAENDYGVLARKRARYVKGSLTWARLATLASNTIKHQLLTARSNEALDGAVDGAHELMHRMETRGSVNGARITKEIRDRINLIFKVALTLQDLRKIVSGDRPTEDAAGRATVLKQRWNLLDGGENAFVRDLMTKAVSKVLASPAPAYVKAMFNRALQHWLPSSPPASVTSSPGTKVEWDSDDGF